MSNTKLQRTQTTVHHVVSVFFNKLWHDLCAIFPPPTASTIIKQYDFFLLVSTRPHWKFNYGNDTFITMINNIYFILFFSHTKTVRTRYRAYRFPDHILYYHYGDRWSPWKKSKTHRYKRTLIDIRERIPRFMIIYIFSDKIYLNTLFIESLPLYYLHFK